MPRVINETRGTVVATDLGLADSIWSRFWGLMGRRRLAEGGGLLLRPASSIHTAFMRFSIDAVFLDRDLRVVKVRPRLRPFWIAAAFGGVHSVLELNAGTAAAARVQPGDQLAISDED